jgi:hypothetical protein
MTLLISISDFTPYKAISANINATKKLEPYILEAQEFDLRPILGDELYNALVEDFEASPSLTDYGDLFNGSEWTVGSHTYKHNGLIPVLCYFAYARYKLNSNVEDTAFGTVTKRNLESDPVSEKTIARQADQARSGAMAYMQKVINFLNDNSDDYPLWVNGCKPKRRSRISDVENNGLVYKKINRRNRGLYE